MASRALQKALAQAAEDEKFLDDRIETAKRRIERSIRELERKFITKAANAAGKATFGLAQAQKLQRELEKLYKETFGEATLEHVAGYRTIARQAQQYLKELPIPKAYATVSGELLDALKAQSLDTFEAMGAQAQNRIAQALYNTVLTGWPVDKLVDEIAGALTGHADVRGRPLSQYANTYAQDSLMETYAATHQQAAQRAGLDSYLYYGTTVRDTRPFCRARVGKVFTAEEVQSWESLTWKGKKPGPVLVVRGGWNCRHQLLPVDPEWIEDEQKDGEAQEVKVLQPSKVMETAKAVAKVVVPLAAPIAIKYAELYVRAKIAQKVAEKAPELVQAAELINAISYVDDLIVMHAGPKALMAAADTVYLKFPEKEKEYILLQAPEGKDWYLPLQEIIVVDTVPMQ